MVLLGAGISQNKMSCRPGRGQKSSVVRRMMRKDGLLLQWRLPALLGNPSHDRSNSTYADPRRQREIGPTRVS